MNLGDKLIFAAAIVFMLYGAGGLLATWVFPRLQTVWLYKPWMLTGSLEENDKNRSVMSLVTLFFGATTAFSLVGQTTFGYVALGLLVAVVILKAAFARQRSDA